jgi:septal ring factor EnvC (AmiA/AmiB activator)
MYSEEFQKVKTKVPFDLWKKVEALGFESANEAVINAFEKLVSDQELNDFVKEQETEIKELRSELENEQRLNLELRSKIQDLETQLGNEQKQNQELQREFEIRMEEAQKPIKDLQKELEKAERREIYFEEMHNNYMMQVQTLINQKQIVAPRAKKPWWRFW